jgi:TonB family protein
VAHDVSLSFSRYERMSPSGLALAALLHAAVALALYWISPLRHIETTEDPIEITVEQEAPTPAPPAPQPPPEPPPKPPPVQAVQPPPPPPAPTPTPQTPTPQTPAPRMGLSAPIGTTMDSRAPLVDSKPEKPAEAPTEQAEPVKEAEKPAPQEAAKPEPPKEIVKVQPEEVAKPAQDDAKQEAAKEEPPQQQAALAPAPEPAPPPPPSRPSLEQALPPLEAPPPPVTSQDIPRPAPPPPPPPPPKPPQPAPRAQTPSPPAPHAAAPPQQLPPSPLSQLPQRNTTAPAGPQQATRSTPSSPFVNPADAYGQRKAQEDYLWNVIRKVSQHRYYPKNSRENSEEGLVVTLVTIARDGRLLDVSINKSSGYRTLDNAVLEIIRESAPYEPLPNEMTGDRHTFVLPLNYRRRDSQ